MTIDELRTKFEEWACNHGYQLFTIVPDDEKYFSGRRGQYSDHMVEDAWKVWQAAHASRDAEVEALQDALFQISVRLKVEREPDMDDMSWHTDMIARAQYLANLEDAAMREEK